MRRIHGLLITLPFLLVVLLPRTAYASIGWWDWLEQLSGPGPFANGWVLDQRLGCLLTASQADSARVLNGKPVAWTFIKGKGQDSEHCLANSSDVAAYIEVRGGRITSDRKELFSDVPGQLIGTVAANTIQSYLMLQFDAFAVGAGGGTMWFTGDQLDGHAARFVLTPVSVAFMPLRLLLKKDTSLGRLVLIRAEEIALIGRLKATDFNSRSTSNFQTKSEVVRSVSITFDLLALAKK
jgi:hypothetical protein